MKIAVLGPGGVGGLLAGALAARAASEVTVVARESTAATIAAAGPAREQRHARRLHRAPARGRAAEEPVDALIVATKAAGLRRRAGADRSASRALVLPLLNGLDHLALLRERFAPATVLAGTIRVEADRPRAGRDRAHEPVPARRHGQPPRLARAPGMDALAGALERRRRAARAMADLERSEAQVMWSKLVRLNALACTTSAYDKLLGEIRSTPALRADLVGAIEEALRGRRAPRAPTTSTRQKAIGELERAHETLGSSMQRDIAAGRAPELDAIPGAVLRAGARHGIDCPTIERLVAMIARAKRARASCARDRPAALAALHQPDGGLALEGERRGCRARPPGPPAWRPPRRPPASASSRSSSCSPSHSTRKLPVTPLSAWIVMPGQDLLALLEAQALHVEVRQADAVRGVRRVLAVVRRHRLGEALEVLGDLARVRHRLAG